MRAREGEKAIALSALVDENVAPLIREAALEGAAEVVRTGTAANAADSVCAGDA
jgi:hypothetical protein